MEVNNYIAHIIFFLDSQSINRSIWFDKHTLTSIHRYSQNTQEGEKLKYTHILMVAVISLLTKLICVNKMKFSN